MSKNFTNATKSGSKHTVTDIWLTPEWIIEGLGGAEVFDLDPCGYKHPEKGVIVKTANKQYTLTDCEDGLLNPWFGNVFLNFPYSESYEWLEKMAKHRNGIVLCFARTETRAWQKFVNAATGILLVNKRIKFLNAAGEVKTNGNAPSALIAYGEENFQRLVEFKKKYGGILTRVENN